jgi:hypothetical protein
VQVLPFPSKGVLVLPPPVVCFAQQALRLVAQDGDHWRRLLVENAGAARRRTYPAARFQSFLVALVQDLGVNMSDACLVVRSVMMLLLECGTTGAPAL